MELKRKSKLPPLRTGDESFGKRLAKIRKSKGYTQSQLSQKIGLTQGLISDYELGKLRAHHEMIIRFAIALEVSADELLGLKKYKDTGQEKQPSTKLLRRMNKIEELPAFKRKVLLTTIDTFLKGAEK